MAQIKAGEIDPPWWRSPLNAQGWSYSMIRHVALPPKPLAGAAIADADLKPFLFRINPHPPDRWASRSSELTPSTGAYGGFDLAALILTLTPLLALVAFADVIRDREGSARQRLGVVQASNEGAFVLGRLVPRAVVVLIVVLLCCLVGILATGPVLSLAVLRGGAQIAAAFVAHALFWLAVAGAFALCMRRAIVSFAAVTALWFVLGVLAPVIVEGGARMTAAPPSPLAVFAAERAEVVRARMAEEELTRDYAARDPLARDMLLTALEKDQLLITPTNLLVQQEVDRRRGSARRVERAAREGFEARARRLASVSPALLARRAIETAAGRDPLRRASFDAQTDAYHAGLQAIFTPLLMRRATTDEVLLPEPFVFQE